MVGIEVVKSGYAHPREQFELTHFFNLSLLNEIYANLS